MKARGLAPAFSEIHPMEDGFLLPTRKGILEDFAQDLSLSEQNVLVATQAAASLSASSVRAMAAVRVRVKTVSVDRSLSSRLVTEP
jgi:hypothetical protein